MAAPLLHYRDDPARPSLSHASRAEHRLDWCEAGSCGCSNGRSIGNSKTSSLKGSVTLVFAEPFRPMLRLMRLEWSGSAGGGMSGGGTGQCQGRLIDWIRRAWEWWRIPRWRCGQGVAIVRSCLLICATCLPRRFGSSTFAKKGGRVNG
jgi:hypothetical protein